MSNYQLALPIGLAIQAVPAVLPLAAKAGGHDAARAVRHRLPAQPHVVPKARVAPVLLGLRLVPAGAGVWARAERREGSAQV